MTFQDIFKSSFVENVEAISVLDMALAMVLAFGVGLFIFFIYKIWTSTYHTGQLRISKP